MYFKGSLFSVGEHIIADVPRSGLEGAAPEDEEKKKEKREKNGGREEEDLHTSYFAVSSNLWYHKCTQI